MKKHTGKAQKKKGNTDIMISGAAGVLIDMA
jgi:hypothetical protein